jgi:hypothetical protein
MPTVSYQYVVYRGYGRPHARQPQAAGLINGFDATALAFKNSSTPSQAELPITVQPGAMTSTLTDAGGNVYDFAFVNVAGSAGGSLSFFTNAAFKFLVGEATGVLFVYVPSGAVELGVSVDAFDVTSGALVTDNFVNVGFLPGFAVDLPLTATVNRNGWISTTSGNDPWTLGVTASPHLIETNADFQEWHYLLSVLPAEGGSEILVTNDQSGSVLAFYKDTPIKSDTVGGLKKGGVIQRETILKRPGVAPQVNPGIGPGAPEVFTEGDGPEK